MKYAQFAPIVDAALKEGDTVNILTGAHGRTWGEMVPDAKFLSDDLAAFGGKPGVKIYDVTATHADGAGGRKRGSNPSTNAR